MTSINAITLWLISLCTLTFSITIKAETTAINSSLIVAQLVTQQTSDSKRLKNTAFLTQKQRDQLYRQLVDFIETYDAEGMATRNFSKKVQWQAYKKIKRMAFLKSNDWQALKMAFDQFAAGFVNLHSHFRFNAELQSPRLQSSIQLGFTYPEITFFNRGDLQTINQMNHKNTESVFNDFEQTSCRYNSTIGCLNSFIDHFNRGKILINDGVVNTITINNTIMPVEYDELKFVPSKTSNRNKGVDISRYQEWKLIGKGHKVAVLTQADNFLLVIENFRYHKTGGDFRCTEPAEELTMCADIQLMRKIFNQVNTKDINLIIDVQNNGGGKENTPFMAELSNAAFKDLPVQFKNTPLLNDESMRNGLFYGSNRAEQWYHNLTSDDKHMKNAWLPVRADFCRADELCELKWIEPNSKRQFKAIYLLTNDHCVSSCDDLVWRLNEFSGAKIVGLPQAADATYSRISGTFYLDSDNIIKHVFHSDGQQAVFNGVKLFSLTIPYSKTLTEAGELRQGRAAPAQFLLPITRDNFTTHAIDSLKELVRLISRAEL